jgi:DnaK suppressor protein
MDEARARQLLADERARVEGLLRELTQAEDDDFAETGDAGDVEDSALPLTDEEGADAVAGGLRDRLAAIERAEARLAAGTYGRSVQSGALIPDERLEADPAAELTVEEQSGADFAADKPASEVTLEEDSAP